MNLDKSAWRKVRLGDVATEYSARENNPSQSAYERFVGSANIGQWDFRVKSWESTADVTSAMKKFVVGDYLLVRRSLYASDFRERAPRAHFDGICSGDILTLREKPDQIANGFLIGVLNSPTLWQYIVANGSGSITRRIKWRELAEFEFLLPPRDQQAKIAELLWAADNVQAENENLKNVLSRIREAYLLQRFGKKNGLAEVSLKDIAIIKRGKFAHRPRNDARFFGGTIPFIQTGDVMKTADGKIINHSQTLNDLGMSVSKLFKAGTVVMTIAGANSGEVAELGIDAAFPDSLVGIEPLQEKVSKDYLHLLLRASKEKLIHSIIENTQKNLNMDIINNLKISVHDRDEQNEILQYIANNQETLLNINQYNIKIQTLISQLINRIFST